MKTRHRWLTGVSSWKQMACWSLFGIVLHACALLPLESALAQDLAEPELKAAEAEEVKPAAADKGVSGTWNRNFTKAACRGGTGVSAVSRFTC